MEARSDASKLEVVKQEMTRMNVYILRIRELKWTGMHATATAAKSLQLCPTPPSLGFSRQEHWSGLPFPSPMHESEK